MLPSRIVIYAQDIENITGRSARGARLLLQKIKQAYGKKPQQLLTVAEFCEYTGLEVEEVMGCLRGR